MLKKPNNEHFNSKSKSESEIDLDFFSKYFHRQARNSLSKMRDDASTEKTKLKVKTKPKQDSSKNNFSP